jgi:hypothetical protein
MSTRIIERPKVEIAAEVLRLLASQTEEQGQVILHFLYQVNIFSFGNKIRIWPTSFLYDLHSDHKSELVHVENISIYPNWLDLYPGQNHFFTLIFTGLPKSCTIFDFIEECGGGQGAFEVRNIKRNESDVYYIRMS